MCDGCTRVFDWFVYGCVMFLYDLCSVSDGCVTAASAETALFMLKVQCVKREANEVHNQHNYHNVIIAGSSFMAS